MPTEVRLRWSPRRRQGNCPPLMKDPCFCIAGPRIAFQSQYDHYIFAPPMNKLTTFQQRYCFIIVAELSVCFAFLIHYIMLSTLFEHEIYLGFPLPSPLATRTYEQSFVGGQPIFLSRPHPSLLECTLCLKERLTFVCQIFCPLQAEHAYNRVLYVLYCEKCERVFRCLKQQTRKGEVGEEVDGHLRVVSENAFEIESSPLEVKELHKIVKKARLEVEEETIDELQAEEDDDEEAEDVKELDVKTIQAMGYNPFSEEDQSENSKEQLETLKHAAETRETQQKRDQVFEQYKKVMAELDGPVLLYSNIPIAYNSTPINPQHFCKHCHAKLVLELQLTEHLLSLNQKLLRLDWGSLLVFTCSNSCPESVEECVVVQYEVDAVRDEEVSALRKRQKNKKRKEQKAKSKSKGKVEEKGKSKGKVLQVKEEVEKQQQEGDWD